MFQVQIQLPTLPVILTLRSDATIAFSKAAVFPTILEQPENGISAIWAADGFTVGKDNYEYGEAYSYKEIPAMLKYLQEKEMEMPNINAGI